jgi:hypothetical protein
VDIEEFYDADERRRASAEVELGRDWHDQYGVRCELNWVEDTGELYILREPVPHEWADPFGGIHVRGVDKVDRGEVEAMTVTVLGVLGDRASVDRVLEGWEQAMPEPDSAEWLADRLRRHGVLGPPA